MVEIFVVVLPPEDLLKRHELTLFAEVKMRVLCYTEASIQLSPVAGINHLETAPIGACESLEDAAKLIEALVPTFPTKTFSVFRRVYADARKAVWHIPKIKQH